MIYRFRMYAVIFVHPFQKIGLFLPFIKSHERLLASLGGNAEKKKYI